MNWFGSTKKKKKKIDKTKNKENMRSLEYIWSLEVVEVVLVQYNLVYNQYQQKLKVLYTFTPNESNVYLLNVEPSNLIFLKTYNIEFDEIIITFTNQNCRSLQVENKVNLTLFTNK